MRTVDWRTLWEEHAEPGELRRVLCALSVSMGGNGGQAPTNCSPSMERIGRRAGMRRDTASKWIKRAEHEGWVNVGRVTGLRNRYYATIPKALAGLVQEDGAVTSQHAHKPGKAVMRGKPKAAPKRVCGMCGSKDVTEHDHPDTGGTFLRCSRCGHVE